MNAPDLAARRRALTSRLDAPVLLVSNGQRARNLPMNSVPFRADSTFLYFTGCDEPGAAALLEGDRLTLFLEAPGPDDALWHGHVETLEEKRARFGADAVRPIADVEEAVAPLRGKVLALAVPDPAQTALAARATGLDLAYPDRQGPDALIDAVIALRRVRDAWELDQMRLAADLACDAHVAAMKATRPGAWEREIAALFDAMLAARGATTSYQSIVTVRGEVLHNHSYVNQLRDDQLLLLDGGAETPTGYASDVTRTWPVRGRFDQRQRDVYSLVLRANVACIEMIRPGVRYRDVHWKAMHVIAEGLRDLGLLRCGPDEAAETGAVGLFFPHGVGHLLGLDVHDLENFGDRPAYAPGRRRPKQFGARNLRLDLDLETDVVVTIEPGVYFVPAILHDRALRHEHAQRVDFDVAERWLGFGGIRIEDDVRVAPGGHEVLTHAIPKEISALESLVGTGPSAAERLTA